MDDEPDITDSFCLALEDTGLFEVETYNDPAEALSNFKSNSYDLVLLDIRMPNMDGFQFYDKIKKAFCRSIEHILNINLDNDVMTFYRGRHDVL